MRHLAERRLARGRRRQGLHTRRRGRRGRVGGAERRGRLRLGLGLGVVEMLDRCGLELEVVEMVVLLRRLEVRGHMVVRVRVLRVRHGVVVRRHWRWLLLEVRAVGVRVLERLLLLLLLLRESAAGRLLGHCGRELGGRHGALVPRHAVGALLACEEQRRRVRGGRAYGQWRAEPRLG